MRITPEIIAWLDQEDERTAQIVRKFGWKIEYVIGEERQASIGYTVGMFGLGHPELVLLGCSFRTTMGVLNTVGAWIKAGRNLVLGEILTFDDWPHRLMVEEVPNPEQILFAANRFYRQPPFLSVSAYQLTYDDKQGRFPWDEGYNIPAWVQPRPGTFTA